MGRGDARRDRLTSAFEAACFGVALLSATLYFKVAYLAASPQLALRAIGGHWTALGAAALFARDVLASLGLAAGAIFVLGLTGSPRRRFVAATLVGLAILVLTVANVTYNVASVLPNYALLADALAAYRAHPDIMSPAGLLTAGKALRLAAVLGLAPLAAGVAARGRLLSQRSKRTFLAACLVTLGASASVAALSPLGGLQARSFALVVGEELVSNVETSRKPLPLSELHAAYRAAVFPDGLASRTSTPPRPTTRKDVVWVVLETAAFEDYPLDRAIPEMPSLARLLPHALVGTNHLASARLSTDSDFALFNSIAPGAARPRLVSDLTKHGPLAPIDSLPLTLRRLGYATSYYYPAAFTLPEDEWATRFAGFEHIFTGSRPLAETPRERRTVAERELWASAAREVAQRCARDEPYLVVVRSAVGHYPFLDGDPETGQLRGESTRRFHNVRRLLDAGFAEILSALESCGKLDSTVIAVVGDHGPRWHVEDTRVDSIFPTARTFRVPLLIYDSQAFPTPRTVSHATSHIDLVPTLRELLGIEDGDDAFLMGMSVLDDRIGARATPFYVSSGAGNVLTGIAWRDRYYCFDHGTGVLLGADRLRFEPPTPVPKRSPEFAAVTGIVESLLRFDAALFPSLVERR